MRLNRSTVVERDTFVRSLVKSQPSITGEGLQVALRGKFSHAMNPGRLYRLKNEALSELSTSTTSVATGT